MECCPSAVETHDKGGILWLLKGWQCVDKRWVNIGSMTLLEPAEIAIISDGQRKVTDFGIQSSKMSYSLAPVDYPKYIHIILKIILRAVAI